LLIVPALAEIESVTMSSPALPDLFHVNQNLGAIQIDPAQPQVQFRLYFPSGFLNHVESIIVLGDFQSKIGLEDWSATGAPTLTKSTIPEGEFWTCLLQTDLPIGFYEYIYQVTFDDTTVRQVADPCARYGGQGNNRSGFVIGGSTPAENVVTALSNRKPLRDLSVYEIHPWDFTAEFRGVRAPLDAIQDKLDYLVELGINAVLIMPWTAWKNKSYDWGYSPFQYFAVEYAYTNDLDKPSEKISWLKNLISECHQREIHVIMDGVYNHADETFPYKSLYLNDSDCPYTAEPFGGTFPGLQDLDFNNQCTNDFIRDVCLYWISVFGIDGIRFDNTVNYYVPGDPRGLPELLQNIEDYVVQTGQSNFSMTLEHLDMDAASLVSSTAATSYWDNGLFEECSSQLWSSTISPNYLAVLNNSQYVSSSNPDKVATLYLSNHDHSQVAWTAGARTNEGGAQWYRLQPHVIALLTSTGTPLIPNGQEFAEDYWIPENDNGTGRRVRTRPLRWANVSDSYGGQLLPLYQKLLKIRSQYSSLRSANFYPPNWENWQTEFDSNGFGVDVSRSLVVFHRWGTGDDGSLELFYIALNFSDQNQQIILQFAENGTWADLLADGEIQVQNYQYALTVESNWGHVFFQKSS
jgi:glycosidase